ncbi:hypothetical protein TEA_015390 [Camellia sinensis var. sinensis]|uniref:Uncharacterized protein n=1 Tax=Camellia sinensis var. sinensis TaxID=542762 RepID=A0A4S4EGI7_CAMSN|nr:hypothetical protein TEA_015390 [Camellia sinensis var. sinensis]
MTKNQMRHYSSPSKHQNRSPKQNRQRRQPALQAENPKQNRTAIKYYSPAIINTNIDTIFGVAFLLSFIKSHEACRVLDEEEEKVWKENLLLQSLRGRVPSFGPNPPTYIPTSSTKANAISQKNFVGHAMPPPEKEERMKNKNLLLQSLKGPDPPLGPNLDTYIPTSNSKVNTISQKGFASHAIPPPTYPQLMVPFGVAKS